jgi:hypothetical protein
MFVVYNFSTNCLGVELGNCGGDGSWARHFTVIYRVDGTDFGSCSTAEDLFGDV